MGNLRRRSGHRLSWSIQYEGPRGVPPVLWALGFITLAEGGKKYLILKNGNALIGLFQGLFEGNIVTFDPGWDESARNVEPFDDVRAIQRHLKQHGIPLVQAADETTTGPASFIITDPDGNTILVDQHR